MSKRRKKPESGLAQISDKERAALDVMIEAARELRGDVQVKLRRTLDHVRISGLGTARVWFFTWAIGDEERGAIAHRPYGGPIEDDEDLALLQARMARYFADGVKAKSVVMHSADGRTERLR